MLTHQLIEIETKQKWLTVSEFTIRQVAATDEDDTGWWFQAILENASWADLIDLEFALRYYDSGGEFIGLDEGSYFRPNEIARHDDKSISLYSDIPATASKGVFSLKAKKTDFLEKHGFFPFCCRNACCGASLLSRNVSSGGRR